jgi:hypothetical protein
MLPVEANVPSPGDRVTALCGRSPGPGILLPINSGDLHRSRSFGTAPPETAC